MASGQLQFLSPDQKYCRNVNAFSASLLQVYLSPTLQGIPTLSHDRNTTYAGLQHSCPPTSDTLNWKKLGTVFEKPWGHDQLAVLGEGWLIFISMHMDALHSLPWMHLALLGIANIPPLYGICYVVLPSNHAWQFCWVPCFTLVVPPEGPSPSP